MENLAHIGPIALATVTDLQAYKNQSQSSEAEPKVCWRCRGTGWQEMPGGVRTCLCQRLKILRTSLRIPPVFGKPKLSRLRPRESAHPLQANAIDTIKQAPAASYLFTGRNGSGKSHMCWALCRAALIRGRRVRAILLSELLGQYRQWELDESASRPVILPDDLKLGYPYTVFLDEFEKAKTTEFASRKLFELLNAARDFEHQLLITSNKEWDGLRNVWSGTDPVYGDSIMKRVEQCRLIEMF